jgi:hypothetical protein
MYVFDVPVINLLGVCSKNGRKLNEVAWYD